jgi:hypothetical protein
MSDESKEQHQEIMRLKTRVTRSARRITELEARRDELLEAWEWVKNHADFANRHNIWVVADAAWWAEHERMFAADFGDKMDLTQLAAITKAKESK